MQCSNNLKQIGLACHNHHSTHGHWPRGTIVDSASPANARLGVFVSLLPYLEEEKLARRFDLRQGWAAPANASPVASPLKVVRCPASAFIDKAPPPSNYMGITGLGKDAAELSVKDARVGIFGHARTVTNADIKDGLAFTLVFLETARQQGAWAAAFATLRPIDADAPIIGKDAPFGLTHSAARPNFGRIPVFAQSVLADGAVKRLSTDASPAVLSALATIAGGEALPSNW